MTSEERKALEKEMESDLNYVYNRFDDNEMSAWWLVENGWRMQRNGTWQLESDEEEPNPMFKLVVCSACNKKSNNTYKYCPNCGAKMIKET